MRHALRSALVLAVTTAALACCALACSALAACGGSATESPWPVEPDSPLLGPAGESSATPVARPVLRADAGRPVGE